MTGLRPLQERVSVVSVIHLRNCHPFNDERDPLSTPAITANSTPYVLANYPGTGSWREHSEAYNCERRLAGWQSEQAWREFEEPETEYWIAARSFKDKAPKSNSAEGISPKISLFTFKMSKHFQKRWKSSSIDVSSEGIAIVRMLRPTFKCPHSAQAKGFGHFVVLYKFFIHASFTESETAGPMSSALVRD